MILKGMTAMQYNGQVGKILKTCMTASIQDKIPVALMNGQRLSVKITNLEIAPTAQSPSLPKITHDVPNTHEQQTVDTIETIKKTEKPMFRGEN